MKAKKKRLAVVNFESTPPSHAPSTAAGSSKLAKQLGVALVFCGLITRLMFLSHPEEVVFDEVHFGKFVTSYCCSGSRFFDIHPPHAKLLIAGAIKLGGYHGQQEFKNIGEKYTDISPFAFRLVPALVGAALPLVVFILMMQLGISLPAAFFGAFCLAFDNVLILQSRVIALDGVLLLAEVGALSACLAGRRQEGWRKLLFFSLSGACCGLAVGTKFTGLIAPALVGVLILQELWEDYRKGLGREGAITALSTTAFSAFCAVMIYLLGWKLHFVLLNQPGSGDLFYRLSGDFFPDLIKVHQSMLSKNYGLTAGHPDASSWWSWPLLLKPIFYWIEKGTSLYLLGNPAVWWGSTVLMLSLVFSSVLIKTTALKVERANYRLRSLWFPLLGYAMAFGPLIPVPRALFLYHYLTPLVFAVISGVMWLDKIGWIRDAEDVRNQNWSYYAAFGLVILGFLAVSPVTYAFPMPDFYWKLMPWTLYH